MSWRDLIRTIKSSGQDALDSAKEKLRDAAANAPRPGFMQAPEDGEEEEREPKRRDAPLLPPHERDEVSGAMVYDLDAEMEEMEKRAREAAVAEASAPSPKPDDTRQLRPADADSTKSSPKAAPAWKGEGGAEEPPSSGRHKAAQKWLAGGGGGAATPGPSPARRTSQIDFIQQRYGVYGTELLAAVLSHCLTAGGAQRLAQRLGLPTASDDMAAHECILRWIAQNGVEVFARALNVRLEPAAEGIGPKTPPVAMNGQKAAGGEGSKPAQVETPEAANGVRPPGADGTGRRAAQGASAHRLKLEGEKLQPVRIQSDHVMRRAHAGGFVPVMRKSATPTPKASKGVMPAPPADLGSIGKGTGLPEAPEAAGDPPEALARGAGSGGGGVKNSVTREGDVLIPGVHGSDSRDPASTISLIQPHPLKSGAPAGGGASGGELDSIVGAGLYRPAPLASDRETRDFGPKSLPGEPKAPAAPLPGVYPVRKALLPPPPSAGGPSTPGLFLQKFLDETGGYVVPEAEPPTAEGSDAGHPPPGEKK